MDSPEPQGAIAGSPLAAHLVARALISAMDAERAQLVAQRTRTRFASALTRLGLVSEAELAGELAERLSIPIASRERLSAVERLPEGLNVSFLRKHAALPLGSADGMLEVALADPEDIDAIAGLRFATGTAIRPLVAAFSDIEDALAALSDPAAPGDDPAAAASHDEAADDVGRVRDSTSDAPVIRLVNRLIVAAVDRRASDIHIEPMARTVVVRLRIDGRLVEVERLADRLAAPVASRIKLMARLDIAETRLPQDGRLRFAVKGRDVDIRVATTPTSFGESLVLRLLGRSEVPLDLDRLGLSPPGLAALHSALGRPHGIILLTGPTGSGKTTTLYAALARLHRPDIKILTVEDPVEVLLDGVNQVGIKPEIGLTYAATLRAFLRQDPDVLMIGEIRDAETAEIAMRAALTGHLVLSTLHTNTALGAFTRLRDIGVEPFLIASTVVCTAAQRLVRVLCTRCREARAPTPDDIETFARASIAAPATVQEVRGCPSCLGSGFRGRTPLIEVVPVTEALRAGVRDGLDEPALAKLAVSESLLHHGLALVAEGRTTLAEVLRSVEAG